MMGPNAGTQSSHQTTSTNNFNDIEIINGTSQDVMFFRGPDDLCLPPGENYIGQFEPGIYRLDPKSGDLVDGDELKVNITSDSGLIYRHCYTFSPSIGISSYTLTQLDPASGVSINLLLENLGIDAIADETMQVSGQLLHGLPPVVPGDVNGDGVVNLLDVQPFVDVLSSGGFDFAADINQDNHVNLLDVNPFIAILAGNGG